MCLKIKNISVVVGLYSPKRNPAWWRHWLSCENRHLIVWSNNTDKCASLAWSVACRTVMTPRGPRQTFFTTVSTDTRRTVATNAATNRAAAQLLRWKFISSLLRSVLLPPSGLGPADTDNT